MSDPIQTPPDEGVLQRLIAASRRDPKFVKEQIYAAWCARPGGLYRFVQMMWPVVEPATAFVPNWHIESICSHLEAVHAGEIKRLLINISPGCGKSLFVNVFFPAWIWGPMRAPATRLLTFSYSQALTVRDNVRFRSIISSEIYKKYWGDVFGPSPDQFSLVNVGNNKTGAKVASSVSGLGTGARADILLIDDPNNVKEAESALVRESTNQWFNEIVPTRLNSPSDSSIIVIQQRTHDQDVSGNILERGMGYQHLCIPMRHDGNPRPTSIGWRDPRSYDEETGEDTDNTGALMWPARYPAHIVDQLEKDLGRVAFAGQFQQIPVPRGGAIFEYEHWNPWPKPTKDNAMYKWVNEKGKIIWPEFSYTLASCDTAFTEREENDYSALVILSVFYGNPEHTALSMLQGENDPIRILRVEHDRRPKVMLRYAWQKRLTLHGPPEHRPVDVTDQEWDGPEWRVERQRSWGLVEWVVDTCKRYKVDDLLIETQAQGLGLQQELRRLHDAADWGIKMITARGGRGALNKVERAWAVQHLFADNRFYAPCYPDTGFGPQWCEDLKNQAALFPRGRFDDQIDALVHGAQHLRDIGILTRGDEHDDDAVGLMKIMPNSNRPLYEV